MMQQNETFRQFFNREHDAVDNGATLGDIVREHPYFGMAHYFLLKNTDPSSEGYAAVAEKASLAFNDDYLMNKHLNERLYVPEAIEPEEPIVETAAPESYAQEEAPAEETAAEKPSAPVLSAPATTETEVMFEPLHASDYFASQGIKLSEDMMGNDKLGKQLRSFTSWLKTMKKVHPDKISETGRATDTAIQSIAEKSNKEEDVVTEAMADAYILQNKHAKAIDTYEKLSLLNPAKSAYFAAKIESLKK